MTSSSSLITCRCIPSEPVEFSVPFVYVSPDLILFHQGNDCLAPDFLLGSGAWDSWRLALLVKMEAKTAFSTSAFSMSCLTRSPVSLGNGPTFSLVLHLSLLYLQNPILLPLTSLTRSNFSWAVAVLTVSLHAWTVFLCSSLVTCPCFHLLYASFLWLDFVRSSSFIHLCLLAFLLDSLESPAQKAALELVDDPWILTSFLGPFFATGPYAMGLFQAYPWRGQVCSPDVQGGHCLVLLYQSLVCDHKTLSFSVPTLPICSSNKMFPACLYHACEDK